MAGRVVRKVLTLGVIGAVAAKVIRVLRGDPAPDFSRHPSVDGGPKPVVTPVAASVVGAVVPEATWRAATDGTCPDGFPVKAKLKSGIFHVPGMLAYERTSPDRCYASAEAAEADGLRAAKR